MSRLLTITKGDWLSLILALEHGALSPGDTHALLRRMAAELGDLRERCLRLEKANRKPRGQSREKQQPQPLQPK